MNKKPTRQPPKCEGSCPGCSAGKDGHSHEMPQHQVEGGFSGGKLVILAAVAFLSPLLLAILGAMIAGGSANRRLVGALIGLAIGVGDAAILSKILAKKFRSSKNATDQTNKQNGPDDDNPYRMNSSQEQQ